MNIKRWSEFSLNESKEDIVSSLLRKTVKNGTTIEEEKSSLEKAVELINKYGVDISKLDIDEDVKDKLYKEFGIDIKNSEDFDNMTLEDYNNWIDDNYEKIEEVGYRIERSIEQFSLLDNYYMYEDEDLKTKGWEFVNNESEKTVEYIFEFGFYSKLSIADMENILKEIKKLAMYNHINDDQTKIMFGHNQGFDLEFIMSYEYLVKNREVLDI